MSNLGDCRLDVSEFVMHVSSGHHWDSSDFGELGKSLGVVHHCTVLLDEFTQLGLNVTLEKNGVLHTASLEQLFGGLHF